MHELVNFLNDAQFLTLPSAFAALRDRSDDVTPEAIAAAEARYRSRGMPMPRTTGGGLGIIDVTGPITPKANWLQFFFGGCSVDDLWFQLEMALALDSIQVIVFRFDSPGGSVTFIPELADAIRDAGQKKTTVAVADCTIASAAYWLASQCHTIYASVSSMLGSIGVYFEHEDISGALANAGVTVTQIAHGARKLDGTPFARLSDAARQSMQANVDEIGSEFEAAVARGRGVGRRTVLNEFGQGQMFRGRDAIVHGLADKLATPDRALTDVSSRRSVLTAAQEHALIAAIIGTVH